MIAKMRRLSIETSGCGHWHTLRITSRTMGFQARRLLFALC